MFGQAAFDWELKPGRDAIPAVVFEYPSLHVGQLEKRGQSGLRRWQTRYYELSGHYLKRFKQRHPRNQSTIQSVIDLRLLEKVSSHKKEVQLLLKGQSLSAPLQFRSLKASPEGDLEAQEWVTKILEGSRFVASEDSKPAEDDSMKIYRGRAASATSTRKGLLRQNSGKKARATVASTAVPLAPGKHQGTPTVERPSSNSKVDMDGFRTSSITNQEASFNLPARPNDDLVGDKDVSKEKEKGVSFVEPPMSASLRKDVSNDSTSSRGSIGISAMASHVEDEDWDSDEDEEEDNTTGGDASWPKTRQSLSSSSFTVSMEGTLQKTRADHVVANESLDQDAWIKRYFVLNGYLVPDEDDNGNLVPGSVGHMVGSLACFVSEEKAKEAIALMGKSQRSMTKSKTGISSAGDGGNGGASAVMSMSVETLGPESGLKGFFSPVHSIAVWEDVVDGLVFRGNDVEWFCRASTSEHALAWVAAFAKIQVLQQKLHDDQDEIEEDVDVRNRGRSQSGTGSVPATRARGESAAMRPKPSFVQPPAPVVVAKVERAFCYMPGSTLEEMLTEMREQTEHTLEQSATTVEESKMQHEAEAEELRRKEAEDPEAFAAARAREAEGAKQEKLAATKATASQAWRKLSEKVETKEWRTESGAKVPQEVREEEDGVTAAAIKYAFAYDGFGSIELSSKNVEPLDVPMVVELLYLCQPQLKQGLHAKDVPKEDVMTEVNKMGLTTLHLAHNNLGGWNGEYGAARRHDLDGIDMLLRSITSWAETLAAAIESNCSAANIEASEEEGGQNGGDEGAVTAAPELGRQLTAPIALPAPGALQTAAAATVPSPWLTLTHLDLSFNNFGTVGTLRIATILRSAPVLTTLDLSGAILAGTYDDDGVWQSDLYTAQPGDEAERMSRASTIASQSGPGSGFASLVSAFNEAPSLTELNLSKNMITPSACQLLAHSLGSNDTIVKLDLSGNFVGQSGADVRTGQFAAHGKCNARDRDKNHSPLLILNFLTTQPTEPPTRRTRHNPNTHTTQCSRCAR
jgi:hypothetical protein